MDPVDQTKTKQLLIDFSHRSKSTSNIDLSMLHAQKRGYLGFNRELMGRINYGS